MTIQTFKSSKNSVSIGEMEETFSEISQIAEPIYGLAIRFFEAKNYPKALRLMEYLLRSQPAQCQYLRSTAIMLQADQQFETAFGFYQRARALDAEKDPRISLGQAQCLVLLKQYRQAMPYLEETIERLKNPALSSQTRNELTKICSPLIERIKILVGNE